MHRVTQSLDDVKYNFVLALFISLLRQPLYIFAVFFQRVETVVSPHVREQGNAPILFLLLCAPDCATAFFKGHRPGTFCNRGFQPTVLGQPPTKSAIGTIHISPAHRFTVYQQ
jgi:hypothetical protein